MVYSIKGFAKCQFRKQFFNNFLNSLFVRSVDTYAYRLVCNRKDFFVAMLPEG